MITSDTLFELAAILRSEARFEKEDDFEYPDDDEGYKDEVERYVPED